MNVENKKDYFKFENTFGSKARIKILKILALNIEQSISQIIKGTNLNHSCVRKHLDFLKSLNLVQEKNFGRIKIFRFKTENIKAKSLKNFIDIWEN
ncbi:MAG: ArsR family transcriptional regulator [Promethearchaeota archaeon]|nr:MAG: ArsR family transcriptional regulator [Candidatus Lokiarchaeota archaeon]